MFLGSHDGSFGFTVHFQCEFASPWFHHKGFGGEGGGCSRKVEKCRFPLGEWTDQVVYVFLENQWETRNLKVRDLGYSGHFWEKYWTPNVAYLSLVLFQYEHGSLSRLGLISASEGMQFCVTRDDTAALLEANAIQKFSCIDWPQLVWRGKAFSTFDIPAKSIPFGGMPAECPPCQSLIALYLHICEIHQSRVLITSTSFGRKSSLFFFFVSFCQSPTCKLASPWLLFYCEVENLRRCMKPQ